MTSLEGSPVRLVPTSRGWGLRAASKSPCQYSSQLVLRYQSMVLGAGARMAVEVGWVGGMGWDVEWQWDIA
jgi:hypothetical protein